MRAARPFLVGTALGLGVIVVIIVLMPPLYKAAEWWFAIWK